MLSYFLHGSRNLFLSFPCMKNRAMVFSCHRARSSVLCGLEGKKSKMESLISFFFWKNGMKVGTHGETMLGAFGCFWVLLGAFGCFWVLIGAYGCLWVLLGAYGCLWVLLGAFGCFLELFAYSTYLSSTSFYVLMGVKWSVDKFIVLFLF